MKVFSAKIYFQAIRYRASGRGALWVATNSRKFYPRKSIFKQLDTVLVGVVHSGCHKFAKVLSAKIYFQAIRYRASGRGALWVATNSRKFYPRKSIFKQLDTVLVGVVHSGLPQIRESFIRENLFSSNLRKFSPAKETRYMVSFTHMTCVHAS